jgi:hypothetical protein
MRLTYSEYQFKTAMLKGKIVCEQSLDLRPIYDRRDCTIGLSGRCRPMIPKMGF